MKSPLLGLGWVLLTVLASAAWAADAAPKPLVNVAAEGAEKLVTPSSEQVAVTRSTDAAAPGLIVTIQTGQEGYPGINLKPAGATVWDLSNFGHVEAKVTNTGSKPIALSLRVDNPGDWKDNPNNSNVTYVKPNATGTVKVIFGYSYGKPGFALKPASVNQVLLFVGKSDVVQSFRVEYIQAGGPAGEKPPIDPKTLRTVPKNGLMLGAGVAIAADKQIEAKGGSKATLVGEAVQLEIPAGKGDKTVIIKPAVNRWDLRNYNEVRVKVKNTGSTPITPKVQLTSDPGPTDAITAASPLAPGATQELVVPFVPSKPSTAPAGKKDDSTWAGVTSLVAKFINDAASSVRISVEGETGGTLLVESITATATPITLPEWVGKRPPVEGEWVKTFDDEFNGTEIDQSKWSYYGPNFWDKSTRWSKDNTIVGGGVVKLRYEKKTGFHNDDPKGKQQKYTAGFLETYGKWVQRYGYYEARMKLPTAPGLWPAFWLMPDRGVAAGPQWARQATDKGGMEFDIMEHLTRWGPYRYNVAMHWDGYDKKHKATGAERLYVAHDKDGFITSGVLWLPGVIVYYCNGIEIARWEDPRVSNVQSNMMFTLPMGGWDNNAIEDSKLPDDFVIDYVRVWQRKDLASPVDGPQTQPATQPAAK